MSHPVEHFMKDAMELIELSYQSGFEAGTHTKETFDRKVSNVKGMLTEFADFLKDYKPVILTEQNIRAYTNGIHLVTDDELANLFLLKTGYDEKD